MFTIFLGLLFCIWYATCHREITVTGEAFIFEKPNEAFLEIGISKVGFDAKKVQEDGVMAMNNLISVFNLAPEDIQTFEYSLQPVKEENTPGKLSYKFDQTARLHIRNIDLVPHFLQLAQEKADYIGNLDWQVDATTKNKDILEVQRQAIVDAHHKAENLLQPLNETLGKARSIQVDSDSPSAFFSRSSGSSPKIEPGQVKISSRVTVVFDIDTLRPL